MNSRSQPIGGGGGGGGSGVSTIARGETLYRDQQYFQKQIETKTNQMLDSFHEIIKISKINDSPQNVSEVFQMETNTTSILNSAEGLLRIIEELKQNIILNDFSNMMEEVRVQNEVYKKMNDRTTKRIKDLSDDVSRGLAELENEYYTSDYKQLNTSTTTTTKEKKRERDRNIYLQMSQSNNTGVISSVTSTLSSTGSSLSLSSISPSSLIVGGSSSKIIDASRKGNVEQVTKLLRKDIKKAEKRDEKGDTCLHKAAMFGHSECVEAILKWAMSSNINMATPLVHAKNNEGYTAIMYAALNNWKECVKILLHYGSDVNERLPHNPGVPLSYSINNGTGSYVWRIENFSKIKDRKIYSNTFQVSGYSWKLVAYPKGSKTDENLSLYLEVANHDSLPDGWSHVVHFSFTINNQNELKTIGTIGSSGSSSSSVGGNNNNNVNNNNNNNNNNHSHNNNSNGNGFGGNGYGSSSSTSTTSTLSITSSSSSNKDGNNSINNGGDSKNKKTARDVTAHRFHKHHTDLGFSQILKKDVLTSNKKSGYLLNDTLVVDFRIEVIPPIYIEEDNSMTYTWKLQKVSTLKDRATSQPFKVGNCRWMIAVYPKGKNGNNYLSIYLKVADSETLKNLSPDWYYLVNFKFSIINQITGQKTTRQVEGKKFKHQIEDWGFPQFMKLQLLNDETSGFINYDDDSMLIELQMDIENQPDRGLTLLHWFAYKGAHDYMRLLLLGGANPNVTETRGRTPLDWCSYNGDVQGAEIMLTTGMADVNCRDLEGYGPLHKAVMNGHLELSKLLIKYGAYINAKNLLRVSPLSLAVRVHRLWCFESLIKNGAEINMSDKSSRSSLHWAVCMGESKLFSMLLKYGIESQPQQPQQINNNNNFSNNNNTNTGISIKQVIENNACVIDDVAVSSEQDMTEINDIQSEGHDHIQAFGENESSGDDSEDSTMNHMQQISSPTNNSNNIFESTSSSTLLSSNASSSNTTPTTTTATTTTTTTISTNSIDEGQISISPLQLNAKDSNGYTPLHIAIIKGRLYFVKKLLEKGADPRVSTKQNENALHIAITSNEHTIVQLLLDNNPSHAQELLNQFDSKGRSPLHRAIINGNPPLVELLVSKGANVNLFNPNTSLECTTSPLADALKTSDIYCIILLLQYDVDVYKYTRSLMKLLSKKLKQLQTRDIDSIIPKCVDSRLGRELKYLVNNQGYHDVTFVVEDKLIYAWKGILCARSDYFKAMFETPLLESSQSKVKMESITHTTFLLVMEFLYTDNIDIGAMGLDDLMNLLFAANRFMLTRLKQLCERTIISHLTVDNVFNFVKISDLYGADTLLSECE
ncbi:hypothetical protein DFA_08291 [Cavenderia fasciculata]|uniref:Ankyrin repeat-containing protein n=1 Tax=Cavenderia fasciculata TaxID=261658 RepID=F4Q5N9_CACFS|nr:uncharacterized protein DFA_08291 [Cavenderia fasciculata]EGG17298.1 hypothetical protein DFA_08291 [Cavenderia fasciculata]|eukprot:XP_004355782.1 hypothetical protein DFA_08291 [Cavenderia fasciculata]